MTIHAFKLGSPFMYLIAATFLSCAPSVTRVQTGQSGSIKNQNVEVSAFQKVGNIPPGARWYNIQCVSQEVCWLGDTLKRWQTTDGGRNWQLVYSIVSEEEEIRGDVYINDRVGWRLGWTGLLFKTEDGGRTWIQQSSTPMGDRKGELRVVKFLKDENTGWLAGGVYRALSKEELTRGVPNNTYDPSTKSVLEGAIFSTKDGGKTWHRQMVPARPGRIYALYFSDEAHGVALSDSGIFYAEGGGERWIDVNFGTKCVASKYRNGYDADPVNVFFLDSRLGWLVFDDGRVAKSTDGGRSWCDLVAPGNVEFALPFDRYFKKICFTNENHGWALGGDGLIYETNDGGAKWAKTTGINFDDIYFLDREHVWAVSKEGLFRIGAVKS